MTKKQEFRKQTEEAKFEAFSVMCRKVVELEQACHKWFMRWREAKKDALYFDSRLQKQIEATYKVVEENNELKAFRQDCVKLTEDNVVMARQRAETAKKLTEAKELLNEFMRISKASDEDFEHDYSELIAEAEQFLKEE